MRKRGRMGYIFIFALIFIIFFGRRVYNRLNNLNFNLPDLTDFSEIGDINKNNSNKNNNQDFPTVLGQASQIPEDEWILSVDGRKVPAWRYCYWLARVCDRLREKDGDGAVSADNGDQAINAANDLNWDLIMDDGRSLNEYAKEQALMDTAIYSVIENLAREYGLDLSDDDMKILENQWAERCEIHGGESAYLRELSQYGLNHARWNDLCRVGLFYYKLRDLIQAGNYNQDKNQDINQDKNQDISAELVKISREFEKDLNYTRVNRILASTAYRDRNAARSQAESFFSQLNGAADQIALFESLAESGDDHIGPRDANDASLNLKLQQIAKTLQVGQVSGILETDEGFSILIRLPPEKSLLYNAWLDRDLQNRAENAEILLSESWENLNAADFDHTLLKNRK